MIWKPLRRRVVERVEPCVEPHADVRERLQREPHADGEQQDADHRVVRRPGRDPQDRHEREEEQQRRTEVVLPDEDEQREPDDAEQRREEARVGKRERADATSGGDPEQLAAFRQVRGEEQDDEELRRFAGLEREGAEPQPQPRAADRVADPRDQRRDAARRARSSASV